MKIKENYIKKPKQPKTAYLFYYFEKKFQIKEIYPQKTNQEIQKLISQEFKNLPPNKKKKYFKLAEKDKKKYVIKIKKWVKEKKKYENKKKKNKENNENNENNENTENEKNENKNDEEKKNNEIENNENENNENKKDEEKDNNKEKENNESENKESKKDEEKNNNEKENNENLKLCNNNKNDQNFSAPNPIKKDKNSLSNEDSNFVLYSKIRRNILSKNMPLISQSDITEIIKDEWEHLSENERNKKN